MNYPDGFDSLEPLDEHEEKDLELIALYLDGELSPDERAAMERRLSEDAAFRDLATPHLEAEPLFAFPRDAISRNAVDAEVARLLAERDAVDAAIAADRRTRGRAPTTAKRQQAWDAVTRQIGLARSDLETGALLDEAGNPLPFRFWNNIYWRARWATVAAVASLALKIVCLAVIGFAFARGLAEKRGVTPIRLPAVADTTIDIPDKSGSRAVLTGVYQAKLGPGRYAFRADSIAWRLRVERGRAVVTPAGGVGFGRGIVVSSGQQFSIDRPPPSATLR